VLTIISVAAAAPLTCLAQGQWPFAGADRDNTRSSSTESKIGPENASTLHVSWSLTTGGDVSATPTVSGNAVYVPDWSGNLLKLNASTGAVIWSRKISDYTGDSGAVSRTSPAISGGTIVIGTQLGGYILAINSATGNLIWKVKADSNPSAIITQSPMIYSGTVYVGVASSEEGKHADNPGFIPTFRGQALALDLATGATIWRTFTVPDGYTGGAVWSSTPVVDVRRKSLYISTGNNYTIPASVQQCIDAARAATVGRPPAERVAAEEACLAPDDYIDAVVSLDLQTGAVKWANRVQGADTWTVACSRATPANPCPDPESPDYDFGSGPNMLSNGLLGAGQKSGVYWAFNPDNGSIVWASLVGPGGTLGGLEWGSATDGTRIYVAVGNPLHTTYRLASGQTHNAGSWAALDPGTGQILWQVPVPGHDPRAGFTSLGALGLGAVGIANGVMYAGAFSLEGEMVALDAATGATLRSIPTNGSVICGPSIVNGTVFWGSGYGRVGGKANTTGPQLFSFTVN
jgi:polyvinyl alcohol dehydrogenase (cytochrome)